MRSMHGAPDDPDREAAVDISVRTASADDLAVITALRMTWNEEQAGRPLDDPAFDAKFADWWRMENSTRTFFVAERSGSAVGMANVKRYDRMPVAGRPSSGSWGYVGNVYVVAAHRNGGIGGALMNHLVAWAAAAGMEHLRLAPSPRSEPFYRRLGFRSGTVVELDPPARP